MGQLLHGCATATEATLISFALRNPPFGRPAFLRVGVEQSKIVKGV